MKYFNTLPKVALTDANGNTTTATDLMARVGIISKLLQNPLIFYEYDVQEGDTPEIVAHKYYGSMDRFWIVLMCNNLLDPQWDWPLNSKQFNQYISDKYPNDTEMDFHSYQKTVAQKDFGTGTITINTFNVTEDEYNNIVEGTNTYSLNSGSVSVTITKSTLTNYDYELQLNEQKRTIKLLNADYATQFENEFRGLMS